MNTKDKCCVIMFDEVAIDSTLQYNRKEDYVEGIEDFGTERNGKLADHANVFMLKGVYRQWVQPVSFTFSSGPIKSDRLVGLLKQVVHECNKLGLDIIASVCDQGAANVAAINKLMAETSEQCLQKKEQNTYFGYIIDNKEIVPLFDVPHLFKGIRNNLLNKNLHFSINGKDMEAKWEHIIQFYLLDISDNTRICPKLTDRHVIPEKINKMKDSLHSTSSEPLLVSIPQYRVSFYGDTNFTFQVASVPMELELCLWIRLSITRGSRKLTFGA
ncbi:hypothetical protein NQ317_008176 [Molorchus minor]|uniref:Transposable element P transposase-like RNase H domain-containing protein n=1 Tax=Molorchus minor TaxID=1323400 RepID=A0ABQ9J6F4_9CUCU|nr:hypothetical protein NQ317_008176 [Molorchus minor]